MTASADDLVVVPAWAVRDRHAIVDWMGPRAAGDREHTTMRPCRGAVVVDRRSSTATVDGSAVALSSSGFLLLERLVVCAGAAQTTEDLCRIIWGATAPARPGSLRTVVFEVRRALGGHSTHVRSVRTVGYRWSAECPSGVNRS